MFCENWLAVLKLPLFIWGWRKDFWREFADRYRELGTGAPFDVFHHPLQESPGNGADGAAPAFRASGYGAQDIADVISALAADGHEIGLHGIDAWADSAKGS